MDLVVTDNFIFEGLILFLKEKIAYTKSRDMQVSPFIRLQIMTCQWWFVLFCFVFFLCAFFFFLAISLWSPSLLVSFPSCSLKRKLGNLWIPRKTFSLIPQLPFCPVWVLNKWSERSWLFSDLRIYYQYSFMR